MSITTIVLVLVLLILVIVLVRWRSSSKQHRHAERRKPVSHQSTQFHAVSIKLTNSACEAAKSLEGRRFLSNAAPRIPLPECDAEACNCRFVHHKDRRSGEDRRDPFVQGFGGAESGRYEQERRKSRERRDEPPEDRF